MYLKRLFTTVLFFAFVKFSNAQTDACGAGATLLTPASSCTPVAGSTVTGFTDSNQGCVNGNEDDDAYYQFIATATTHTVTVDGAANFDAVLGVYNSCGGTQPTGGGCTDVTFGDGIETVNLSGLTIGNTYFICVHDYAAGGGDFTICVTGPPTNDACSSPISLTPASGSGCVPTAGSSSAATLSGQGCTLGTEDDDVWYSFTATNTTHYVTVDGASNFDAVLGVYSTCAGAQPAGGTCVDATGTDGNETVTVTGLTIGVTYLICIYDYATGGGDFTVCVTSPLTNDACASSTSITPGVAGAACSPTSGSSFGATASGQGCTIGTEDDDVWYSFVATNSIHTVLVNGSANFDAVVGVYVACGGAQPTGGNCIDATGTDGNETLTLSGLTVGATYLICIYDYAAGSGDFTVCVTTPGAPTDADCAGGTTICSNANLTGNSAGAGNVDDFSLANTDCLDPPENQTSWFYFSSSTNGTIGFTITPALTTDDYDWAIWGPMAAVTCPPTAAPIRCSAADGNGTPANITGLGNGAGDTSEGPFGDGWVSLLNVLAGEVYIMVIDNWTGTSSPFTLSWQLSGGASLDCTPLPIELLSFSGSHQDTKNKLEWKTSSETNNDFFILEHSADAMLFEVVCKVDGSGNTTNIMNYYAFDHAPYPQKTYYRLKQIDFDGRSKYSSIIVVEDLSEISLTNVHPNPTTADLNFDFSSPVRGIVKIQIVDYLGRVVVSKFQKVEEGKSSLMTQMGELAKGVYTLKVEFSEGDFKSITKVVKQ